MSILGSTTQPGTEARCQPRLPMRAIVAVLLVCFTLLLPGTARRTNGHCLADHRVEIENGDRGFDAHHYNLSIEIADSTLSGRLVMSAGTVADGLREIVLDLYNALDVTVVGSATHGVAAYSRGNNLITIILDAPLSVGELFEVAVDYGGKPPSVGGPVQGDPFNFAAHGSADDGTRAPSIFTLSVPNRCGAWWPCKDVLSDKATIDLSVTVLNGLVVASNGTMARPTYRPDGRTNYYWSHDYPISPYLVSLAVSNYVVLEDSVTIEADSGAVTVPLVYYVYPEDVENARYDFERVGDALAFYSTLFGPYPFRNEKYAMAEVMSGSGMEHQTCTSLGSKFVKGDRRHEWIYVHELAHQWWGDWVGLKDWRDVWLNEGFATYCEALWVEHTDGREAFLAYVADFDSDPPPEGMGFYGPIYDPPALFGPTPYKKGAWVLHMLRHIVGDNNFFEILRTFAERHGGEDAVDTADFQAVCEEIHGATLESFFSQWIHSPGRPHYRSRWGFTREGDDYELSLRITQTQDHLDVYEMPIDVEIETAAGTQSRVVENTERDQTFVLTLDDEPIDVRIDPANWILKALAPPLPPVSRLTPQPNPALGQCVISYVLPEESHVSLGVYDLAGRLIRSLVDQRQQGIEQVTSWDGRDDREQQVASGVYYLRLDTPSSAATTPVVLLR
ncbi:M1 family aminopeptidase [Candidatus Eisenbacteria bacterium]|uniref:Aminopeptidase N n=1 Tax=Eiseniibacteriota bacterium TaxID=2212470 RepID=A0ABV6YK98_UNCEI